MNRSPLSPLLPSLLLAAALLTGCYSYAPLVVSVRDRATHEPLEGATVTVRNTSLLNPVKPKEAEGVTNAAGEVLLEVALYNDLIVRIAHPAHADHVWVGAHPYGPDSTTADRWLGPLLDEAGGRATLELRVR